MQSIINSKSITFWSNHKKAEELAKQFNEDDKSSTYEVQAAIGRPGQFVIAVLDEDNYFLGYV